jgi:rubrerythrin
MDGYVSKSVFTSVIAYMDEKLDAVREENKKLKQILSNLTHKCPICLLPLLSSDMFVSRCNHVFHDECVKLWWSHVNKKECPLCKTIEN